jgi:hypothetical protein
MRHCLAITVASMWLLGCAPTEQPRPSPDNAAANTAGASHLATLSEGPGQTRYLLEPNASELLFYTWRGGKLAKFGHNHVVAARALEGQMAVTDALVGSRFELHIPLAQLQVDEPLLRAAGGESFASKPTTEDVAATRQNMLGERGLDESRYPVVRIHGDVIQVEQDRATLSASINIHGVTQRQNVVVTLTRNERTGDASSRRLRIRGKLQLNQTDFGITPFSIMLGALTVLDEVSVTFDLAARTAS